MPKTFPIRLEVEEIALGTVLRKLNDMPGIAKLDLDLGKGGEGSGRKQLDDASVAAKPRINVAERIIQVLATGAMKTGELVKASGCKTGSIYSMTKKLKETGIITQIDGRWTLTDKAREQINAGSPAQPAALPAPGKLKKGPGGRASPGSGNIVLKQILSDGPKTTSELEKLVADKGMSAKSIQGIVARAKKAGLIKKNGNGFSLTPKGQAIEVPANG